jgi:hypothetical protein
MAQMAHSFGDYHAMYIGRTPGARDIGLQIAFSKRAIETEVTGATQKNEWVVRRQTTILPFQRDVLGHIEHYARQRVLQRPRQHLFAFNGL